MGCANFMNTTNTLYYEAPGASVASAQALNNEAKTPLTSTAQLWQQPLSVGGVAEPPPPLASSSIARSGSHQMLVGIGAAAVVCIVSVAGMRRRVRRR